MNNNLYNFNNFQYAFEYLKSNLNKNIEIHVSFSDSIEWRDSIFTGKLLYVGKDYIVINKDNKRIVIWSIYIDYIIIE